MSDHCPPRELKATTRATRRSSVGAAGSGQHAETSPHRFLHTTPPGIVRSGLGLATRQLRDVRRIALRPHLPERAFSVVDRRALQPATLAGLSRETLRMHVIVSKAWMAA